MSRWLIGAVIAIAACVDPVEESVVQAVESPGAGRAHVVGDVYHHSFTRRLGDGPNARIRLHRVVRERAPWLPRATRAGVVLLHGDFSSFDSNFTPMATWLAQHDVDVWGVDRRWAVAPADADLSDFGDMGLAQEIDDTGVALAAARAVRAATGSGFERLHLAGFSRGGFVAYAYAAAEGARPAALRHVKGLVPLDVWAELPPEDTEARAILCEGAAYERDAVAAGEVDSPNGFFHDLVALARTAPDEPSPFSGFLGDVTNYQAFLVIAAQTYKIFPPTASYHLAAGDLVDGLPAGLTESPEDAILDWFAAATPHQSMREAADTDSIWCGDGNQPFTVDLSRIRVPLFYLGAAGGYGDHGLYSTTRVSSSDVTTQVVRRFGPDGAFEDFGHGDLLFADDAPALVWQPLRAWLVAH